MVRDSVLVVSVCSPEPSPPPTKSALSSTEREEHGIETPAYLETTPPACKDASTQARTDSLQSAHVRVYTREGRACTSTRAPLDERKNRTQETIANSPRTKTYVSIRMRVEPEGAWHERERERHASRGREESVCHVVWPREDGVLQA